MIRPGYSEILRVIGDDLERRGLKAFQLERSGDRYVARCGYQFPPAVTPLILEYRQDDIEELQVAGVESRSDRPQNVDFSALAQILRTIGGYLDQRNASLHTVTNNEFSSGEPVFRIEYESAEREVISEERSTAELYELGVRLYKQRGDGSKERGRVGGNRSAGFFRRAIRPAVSGEREER